MKKKLSILITLALTSSLLLGCAEDTEKVELPESNQIVQNKNSNKSTDINIVENDSVEKILAEMSIEEKIGQMTIIGIHGYELNEINANDDLIYSLNNFKFGGVILYARNIENREQVKKFVSQLQKNRFDKNIPLFISIDEEGGNVSRLKPIENEVAPAQEILGNSGNISLAKEWAIKTAQKLKFLGINVNFAPVADVGSPDTRSFSNNADITAKFVDSAAKGYEEEKFIYCLKHFPGIGKRIIDPHQEISSIDVSRETLEKEDILPFKYIIDNHDNNKFMIMVSHLKYPSIDANNSATLSHEIVTNLLRNKLNFKGIIITDDLEMGAISNYNTFTEVGVKAVKAGADILLVCHEYSHEQDLYNGLLAAVKSGEISEERINESVRRILKVKLENLKE